MQIHGVPHPKTKTTVQIGIFDGTLHEIQRVKKANSSWFIDETVEKCGYARADAALLRVHLQPGSAGLDRFPL